jgi:hypothetical protein
MTWTETSKKHSNMSVPRPEVHGVAKYQVLILYTSGLQFFVLSILDRDGREWRVGLQTYCM